MFRQIVSTTLQCFMETSLHLFYRQLISSLASGGVCGPKPKVNKLVLRGSRRRNVVRVWEWRNTFQRKRRSFEETSVDEKLLVKRASMNCLLTKQYRPEEIADVHNSWNDAYAVKKESHAVVKVEPIEKAKFGGKLGWKLAGKGISATVHILFASVQLTGRHTQSAWKRITLQRVARQSQLAYTMPKKMVKNTPILSHRNFVR